MRHAHQGGQTLHYLKSLAHQAVCNIERAAKRLDPRARLGPTFVWVRADHKRTNAAHVPWKRQQRIYAHARQAVKGEIAAEHFGSCAREGQPDSHALHLGTKLIHPPLARVVERYQCHWQAVLGAIECAAWGGSTCAE